ncbi:glycosyltransferase family 2 protein [Actinoalloteichus sp. GBA129-24]|uniref:glycosyltransferase family 2 protein n=1 Tax=Actinoalloteichus sp. GBA129-24 TaxID=1612551 RepID=UPI000950419F|nr:glycosyltransferase [Actinoalloteichus sp. GBA129-24]APU20127.1 Glycosyl transferase family 2 [Actinoalloteichus sp. GBA129-24]
MPLISILTAAYAPSAQHLAETISSVTRQELPTGWDLEWIVQEDGPEPTLASLFDHIPNCKYEPNGVQLGLPFTRNLALSRASGSLIQALDHDDVLLDNAIATVAPRFIQNKIGWAIGQADDLMPDGSREAYPPAFPHGIVPAGTVNTWALQHHANWPIHCAGLLIRSDVLRAIGGWAGSPADDDVSMMAALSEIADGWSEEEVTWLYRKHDRQTSRTPEWRARSTAGRRIALQRAAAARSAGLRISLGPLQDSSPADAEVGPPVKG